MNFDIRLFFENYAADLTPQILSNGWRKWPKFLQKIRFLYTFEDYNWSVRDNWYVILTTLSSNQDLGPILENS